MSQTRWRNNKWRYLLLGYILLLLIITGAAYMRLIPASLARVPLYDVIGHFVLYGIAGYLAHRAANRRWVQIGPIALPVGGLIAMGCASIEEALQSFSPNRSFDLKDLVCNGLGIGLACYFDKVMHKGYT